MKIIRTMLIVDDEVGILKTYQRMYRCFYGVKVRIAANLTQLRDHCTQDTDPPDLVLMDGRIGHESGVDGMKILKEHGITCPIVTHSDTPHLVKEMLRLGAVGSLSKPSEPHDLERILQDAGYELAPLP